MSEISARKRLLHMMSHGQKPLGIFISSVDPAVTQIMGNVGFDYVVIDNEHGRNDRKDVENHVRAAAVAGITVFVRILDNSQPLIQSMLDVGADGVVVPHIDTADDARRAVEASYYAPRGKRGTCPACHSGDYTLDNWIAKTRAADDNVMVIPILESRKSIANIADILTVQGIDIVHFGPGDLSADMGLDLNVDVHLLQQAWQTALTATHAAGKRMLAPIGFGFDKADMFISPMDYMLLNDVATKMVADHKASLYREKATI